MKLSLKYNEEFKIVQKNGEVDIVDVIHMESGSVVTSLEVCGIDDSIKNNEVTIDTNNPLYTEEGVPVSPKIKAKVHA